MGYITATFLGKNYSIPEDVLVYIDLLEFTDSVKNQLVNTFVRKLKDEIRKDNIGLIGDEDLVPEVERQVGRFIAKLCDNGIFIRTINDYWKNNKGYQLYSDVNKAALEKMKSLLIQEMDAWQAGYEDAVNKAESHVTGMGFSILSGSFVNHAIYAAMESSTLNKQSKEAEAQYQRDMSDLRSRLDSQYGGEKSKYINNTYIPNMEAALTVFAYELLDKYVADLIANGKFDRKTLDYVDISRSDDLLKNLALSANKKAIIESAFAACPYNTAVYMQAIKHDLLDYDSFQTAKVFKQGNTILSFLKENCGEVSFPTRFNINYYCVGLLASLTGKTSEDYLRVHTEQYATGIVKAYARVAEMIADKDRCCKVIGECKENAILESDSICHHKARSYVNPIAPDSIWNQLTEQCGQKDLLKRIKKYIPQDIPIESKANADKYFTEQLFAAFDVARKELADDIFRKRQEEEERRKEELRRKQEAERTREEKRQKQVETNRKAFKVLMKAAAGLLAVVIVYFAVLFVNDTVIGPAKQYKAAIALMEAGDYQSARDIFVSLDGYKNSEAMIEQCNAADIEAAYNAAIQLMNEKEYIEAIAAFRKLGGYKDSDVLIGECQSAFRDSEYNQALQLMNDGKYEEAIEAFEKLGEYNDCKEKIAECEAIIIDNRYIYAIGLANEGAYDEAIGILEELGEYRDAVEVIAKCHLLGCEVGDEIVFGAYEQDGDSSNGAEDIEWIVLSRDDDKVLVISKYCIEQMPFNETLAPVTWEDSTIRDWLNSSFLRTAFTSSERTQILTSSVPYPDDAEEKRIDGETRDEVFLLSENEVLSYLESYASRKATATEYVSTTHCYWILRTHGSVSNVAHVDYKGHVGYYENVDRNWWIRPAMWIEIDDVHFEAESTVVAEAENKSTVNVNPIDLVETAGDNFDYVVLNDGTIEISEYVGSGSSINIPTEIDGYTVSSIGKSAFRYCESIHTVNIPATVTNIGEYAFADCSVKTVSINGCAQIAAYAFYDCEALEQLTISDGVTSIGQSAFRYSGNIQSLELPGSITNMGEYAFADSGIRSLHINGCLTIPDYAFYDCENLEVLIISDGVTSIGQSAFRYCGNVKSLAIPSSVTEIGEYAFADSGIIALHLNGCPNVPDYAFYDCENLTAITISDGVKSIGQSAFRYCGNVESLAIPASVTKMGEYVFADSGVQSLHLDGCPVIPNYAFYDCENLKEVVISDGVNSIGQSAFRYCSSLENVIMETENVRIGEYAFSDCDRLKDIPQ